MSKINSHYDNANMLYAKKANPSVILAEMNEYLDTKINKTPVGIDAMGTFIIAKCRLRLKQYKEAEELFKTCLSIDSKNIQARLELGKLYASQDKEEEAEKLFKECLSIDPKNVHARLELGKLYAGQGKEEEAEELFKEYISIDPKTVHARLELGRLYAGQDKEEEAETLFKEHISIDPKDIYARLELGRLYAKQDREEEAKELFKECLSIDPKTVHARLELGRLYAKQDREEEAEALFKECLSIDPKNVHARLELGKLYVSQGKEEEAEALFKECLSIDSKNVHARLELERLYAKQGREAEIDQLFKESLTLDSDDLYAQLVLSDLNDQNNDCQENLITSNYPLLNNDGLVDGLSCEFAYALSFLPPVAVNKIINIVTLLMSKNPIDVTPEKNDLIYYLKFRYENIVVYIRFFIIGKNDNYIASSSPTFILPVAHEFDNGIIDQESLNHGIQIRYSDLTVGKLEEVINNIEKQLAKDSSPKRVLAK